jgi:uncharacterized protein (TIGR03067 family)
VEVHAVARIVTISVQEIAMKYRQGNLWIAVLAVFYCSTIAAKEETPPGQGVLAVELLPQPVEGKVLRYLLSPDAKRLAYEVVNGGRSTLVLDGKAEKSYDEIVSRDREPCWAFSGDSRHFAYSAREGGRYHLVLDGKVSSPFRELRDVPFFSCDNSRAACRANREDRWCFVVLSAEGETLFGVPPEEDRFVDEKTEFLTADQRHFGYQAEVKVYRGDRNAKKMKPHCNLVFDGKDNPPYDRIGNFAVSRSGAHYQYVGEDRESNIEIAVVDGKEVESWRHITMLRLSPDGMHYALGKYMELRGPQYNGYVQGQAVVRDGRPLGFYNSFECPEDFQPFSPDSQHFALPVKFMANTRERSGRGGGRDQYGVVNDGKNSAVFQDLVQNLTFSPNGARLAFQTALDSREGDRKVVVVDGKTSYRYTEVGSPLFSPDSRRVAFWAKRHDKELIVVDGVEGGPEEAIGRTGEGRCVFFSPDSKHYAYLGSDPADKDRQMIVIDGQRRLKAPLGKENPPWAGFSEDSEHFVVFTAKSCLIDGLPANVTLPHDQRRYDFPIILHGRQGRFRNFAMLWNFDSQSFHPCRSELQFAPATASSNQVEHEQSDLASMAGVWTVVELRHDGQSKAAPKEDIYSFREGTLTIQTEHALPARLMYQLHPQESPKQLDLILAKGEEKEISPMIYAVSKARLTICYAPPGAPRPDALETKTGDGRTLVVMERRSPPPEEEPDP